MVNDEGLVAATVARVLAENPKSVEEYRGGKEKVFGFLVGQAMKALKGKVIPPRSMPFSKKPYKKANDATAKQSEKPGMAAVPLAGVCLLHTAVFAFVLLTGRAEERGKHPIGIHLFI